MAELPTILAGPIVRRVDAHGAAFWIALDQPVEVVAHLWTGRRSSTGPGTVDFNEASVGTAAAMPRRFGAKLHVAVVYVRSQTSMLPGTIYSYDLVINGVGLLGHGLLRDERNDDRPANGVHLAAPRHLALGYIEGWLPSFTTAAPLLSDLRLAQASCRKTGGDGPDALAWLDDIIYQSLGDPAKRPQQLFLTGDQIYADDVSTPLLPMLAGLAADLTVVHKVPLRRNTDEDHLVASEAEGTLQNFPALRRARVFREQGRFTSLESANHLLTFGELAAMYLAVWSPRVWRLLATEGDVFVGTNFLEVHRLTDWKASSDKKLRSDFKEQQARIAVFREAVPRVARALANVATYMQLDDHEVTDDWNLTKRWRTRVLTTPFGRAYLRSALCAYAVFQAWGNDPAAFSHTEDQPKPDNELLLDAVESYASTDTPDEMLRGKLDELLGLTAPDVDPKVCWHYNVPGPRHLVRVLDTRTRRRYAGEGDAPPRLLGDSLDVQLPAGPLPDGRELLVLLSPAPVLFPRLFDTLVQPAAAQVLDFTAHVAGKTTVDPEGPVVSGSEQCDAEGWFGDELHLEALIRRAATYPRVVILSGDVHFTSAMALDFWAKGSNTVAARIVQLTASAARNPPGKNEQAVLKALRWGQWGLRGVPFKRLGWENKSPIQVPSNVPIRPGRRARLGRSPSLNTATGWPEGTSFPAEKPPDWRWSLRVIRDERESTEVGAPHAPALPKWDPKDVLATYCSIAFAHAEFSLSRTDPIRLMVFQANLGVVRFEAVNGAVDVVHEVWSSANVPPSIHGAPWTLHRASLDLPITLLPPTLEFRK